MQPAEDKTASPHPNYTTIHTTYHKEVHPLCTHHITPITPALRVAKVTFKVPTLEERRGQLLHKYAATGSSR